MINNWKLAALALATLATMAAFATIPQEWAVEVSRVKQYQFQANRGDTMELKATFWHDGEPFDLGGDTFRLYWQTNGMDNVYWSAAAVSASNTVSAVFANTMDPGAPIVYGFLGATSGNYRASFAIRFAPGPGATPNALPLPAPVIDFAKVEVLNPPWSGEIAVAASSATNYTDSTASTLRDDIANATTDIARSALAQNVQASLDKADTALQTAGGTMTGQLQINQDISGVPPVPIKETGLLVRLVLRYGDVVSAVYSAGYIVLLDGNNAQVAVLTLPTTSGTLALTSDIPSLSGQTFDFATTQGVMDALKTVIEALGGTVTNAPSAAISQGE